MAIENYTGLVSAVARWLHRADLTDAIPDFVMMAEKRIYRVLRVRAMEQPLSVVIASGVAAVPADYLEMKNARIAGASGWALMRKDGEWIYKNYPTRSADGSPEFFAREGDNFIFGPYPDDGYTMGGTYYAMPEALSDTNTSNWFTANTPDLLLFACLCESAAFIQQDQMTIDRWENKYAAMLRDLIAADRREEFSGSPLQMTAR